MYIWPMETPTTPPLTDPAATALSRAASLAASLGLWVAELVVWLAAVLGDGPLGAPLRRWTMAMLHRAEQAAKGLVVLAALPLLPAPFALPRHAARPPNAPRGFVRQGVRGNDMRRITRHLFPRALFQHQRDLTARAQRLAAFLAALPAHARRLARRIARLMPANGFVAVAPPAARCVSRAAATAASAWDTS